MAWDYFWGHVYEGVGFSMMGLWWMGHMLLDYRKSVAEGKPYITQLSYPVNIRGRSIPLEIIVKICFFVFFACIGPWWTHCRFVDDDGNFINLGVLTHSITLSIFIIHSLADLADYLKWTSNKQLKFITAALAWGWCAMAFYFHSDAETGKSALERRLHRMLVPLMSITALVWLVETFKRDSVTIQAIRCYTLLAIGAWFIYIGHVLYMPFPGTGSSFNPAWDVDNHKNVHFVMIAFAINLNVTLLIVLGSFYITESCRKCCRCFLKNRRFTDPNDNIDEIMSLLDDEIHVNDEDDP